MILEDHRLRLEPLLPKHAELLRVIAAEDKLIQYSPSDIGSAQSLLQYIESAQEAARKGTAMPFAIYDKESAHYVGSTRYMNMNPVNKVLEVGSTWIGRAYQGTGLNTHMKILMLDNAFGAMEYEKVEFRIDERNIRSRKAIEKLGAVLEGVLRQNVYLLDGFKRNTCCYGILKEEWKSIKQTLNTQ